MISGLQLIIFDLVDNLEEECQFVNEVYNCVLKILGLLDEIIYVFKIEYGIEKVEVELL